MADQLDSREKLEIALIRAEAQKRFQVMIDYIKGAVGEGTAYNNGIARLVISPQGAYYELADLPEEFVGAVGRSVSPHFVSDRELLSILSTVESLTHTVAESGTSRLEIVAFYNRKGLADRKGCFIYEDCTEGNAGAVSPRTVGSYRSGVLPKCLKIRIDTTDPSVLALYNTGRFLLFAVSLTDERSPLVLVDTSTDPATELGTDLSRRTIH